LLPAASNQRRSLSLPANRFCYRAEAGRFATAGREGSPMGLKVFLSYAHADTTALVERLEADLRAAGHDPWRDHARIKFTDDWRAAIIKGLHDTDLVLAILSPAAVRAHGVCLDEIAIALRVRHGAVATILAAPEADTAVPASIGHLQWLDMHDWASLHAQDPVAWEAWYAPKLQAILALLADPARHEFTGEISELVTRLKPVIQTADIFPLIEGFVGREWLAEHVNDWRLHQPRKVFWLAGGPGTGKSAFAAWITHYARANVVGLNLCKFGNEDRTDARKVIRTLAFLVATRLADYRHALLRMLRAHDPDGQETAGKSAPALFGFLLAEPLQGIDGGRRTDRFVLVIDALDETVERGESVLAEVLGQGAKLLPPWMALLVTSRPEFPAAVHFAGVPPLRLDADAQAANQAEDVHVYARAWLGDTPTAAVVAAKAAGNFLYLRKLREAVEAHGFPLDPPSGLPQGLQALYYAFFRRQFPTDAAYEPFVPLLEVLAAAERPVPLALLRTMFPDWEDLRVEARILAGLGSLFDRRHEALAPFHSSVRDFLTDPALSGAAFVVTALFGRRRLVRQLWTRFLALPPGAVPDAFLLGELPAQVLALAERPDEAALREVLEQAGPWIDVAPRLQAVAAAQRDARAWEAAEAWFALLAALGGLVGSDGLGWRRWALVEQGDVLVTQGRSTAALATYQASGAAARQRAEANPEELDLQRDLAASYSRVGDVQVAQGNLPEALNSYRDSLAIFDRLARADPGNAGWQRDLAASYSRVGDVQVAQGNLPEALNSYRDSLAIFDRLARADPGNAGWQRDLSVSYGKVGDVLVAQGNLPEALNSYRDSLAIADRLARADPGNAGWQRDLSVSYNKVADVLVAQGNLPEALNSYRDSLAIRDRLARADPGNADWQRDLSVSYDRVGDVQVAQGNLPEALNSYRDSLAIADRLARADPGNAEWQRDLSVSYNKVADVLAAQGNLPEALKSYRDSLAIADRLARADPGNAGWQRDLSVSLGRVADTLLKLGRTAEARPLAERALAQLRSAIARMPDDPQLTSGLAYYQDLLRHAGGTP
jgi:tetratricopeptide (TPR) repeat protein